MNSSIPHIGAVIAGKYCVERLLGKGGMGVVFAARHLQLGHLVALKFLHEQACSSREAVSRFMREGQALARLASPHVARVMDVGTLEQGEPFLVMEYLDGVDLGTVLAEQGPRPVHEAVSYLLQACAAIAEAHAIGMVHRDLKPSNLFLAQGPDNSVVVKVLDFGISKAALNAEGAPTTFDTSTGAVIGSPPYMSPEQIRDAKHVDARSDVWALGVILHELLSNTLPFRGESMIAVLAAVVADAPAPIRTLRADVPRELEVAILTCLQKDPADRYRSVAEFASALADFAPAPAAARHAIAQMSRLLATTAEPELLAATKPGEHSDVVSRTLPSWERFALSERSRRRMSSPRLLLPMAALITLVSVVTLRFMRPVQPAAADTHSSVESAVDATPPGPPNALAGAFAQEAQQVNDVVRVDAGVSATLSTPSNSPPHGGSDRTHRVQPRHRSAGRQTKETVDDEGTMDRK